MSKEYLKLWSDKYEESQISRTPIAFEAIHDSSFINAKRASETKNREKTILSAVVFPVAIDGVIPKDIELFGFICFNSTEDKLHYRTVRASEKRLICAIEGADNGIFDWDPRSNKSKSFEIGI